MATLIRTQKRKRVQPDVALLIPSYAGGGAERVAFFVCRALADAGLVVDLVVARSVGPMRDEPLPGVNRVHLDVVTEFLAAPSWCRYLREARPRVALSMVHTANLTSGLGAYVVPGVPVIVSLHYALRCGANTQWWFRRAFGLSPERWIYRRAAKVIGVSEGLTDEAVSEFRLSTSNVATIYNPRERPDDAGEIAPEHEGLFDKPVVLGVGRLSAQKDFAMLLCAFAETTRNQDANLLILGSGPEQEALEDKAAELGISDRVFLPGFVENPIAYMKRAAVFALSSRHEGFPMVLIEAMQSGVPIVSTGCRHGPSEMLDHGRFGTIVPVGDWWALGAAITAELEAPRDLEATRAKRVEWLAQFDPEIISAQYVKLVREVLSGANGSDASRLHRQLHDVAVS